jgi:hypothetical protein
VNTTACDREQDVLEAVTSGRWPPVDPENNDLRGHVDRCQVCRDLAIVAAVLQDERDEAWRDAHVPTSGQVWWRASARTRAEGAATAARPITVVQGLAGACAAGLCAALVTLAWPSIQRPLAGTVDMLREAQRLGAAAVSAAAMQQTLLSIVVVLGTGLVLTPLVLYFVLSDD